MEDIDKVLNAIGSILTFTQGELLAIPGFQVQLFSALDSNYEIEKPMFSFQAATKDCADLEVITDDVFSFEDEYYIYSFSVDRTPLPDLTGWSKISANYITREVK